MRITRHMQLFVRLFSPAGLLLLIGVWFYGQAELMRQWTPLSSREALNVSLASEALARKLGEARRDLMFLSNHSALHRAIKASTPENLTTLAEDFANFSGAKRTYDQIRWLDERGKERVRVDFRDAGARVVPREELQDKSGRYYFTDTLMLRPGEIFVSPLDLNIERGKVEIPYRPMIRLGTPVTDDRGTKRGIVLLNYSGSDLLGAFADAAANIGDHISLLNDQGYWLKSDVPEREWGFMLERPEATMATHDPLAWERIQAAERGQLRGDNGLWTWDTVYPLREGRESGPGAAEASASSRNRFEEGDYSWKVVAHLRRETLDGLRDRVLLRLAGIGGLLLAVLGLGSWKLAGAWALRAEAERKVRRVNSGLLKTVNKLNEEIRQRVELEHELELAGKVVENALEGIVITDHRNRIISANKAFTEITGFSEEEILGRDPGFAKSGRHGPEFYADMWKHLWRDGCWRGEIWDRRKNGEVYPKLLSIALVKDDEGNIANGVGVFSDITQQKLSEQRLEQLAFFDPLTGLPNRALFKERLSRACASGERRRERFALLFIDLDEFKTVNDTLGHDAGDELLLEVAKRLRQIVKRESDTVARLGGDEFIVLLEPVAGEADASRIAAELIEAVGRPIPLRGGDFNVGCSIGIALYPNDGRTQETLAKNADAAMYHAKARGRNNYQLYRTSRTEPSHSRPRDLHVSPETTDIQ